jgi:purine-binding chemotaxis protein CheW
MAGQRFAVPLTTVVRVLPALAVTPIPGAPTFLTGVFDLHGELVPVLDRQGRSAASIHVNEQLVLVRTKRRMLALRVDEVIGVVDADAAALSPLPSATEGLETFQGTTRLDDDLVLVHDVEMFLSPHAARAVDAALEAVHEMTQETTR